MKINKNILDKLTQGEKNDFLEKYCPNILERIEKRTSFEDSLTYRRLMVRAPNIDIDNFSGIKNEISKSENFLLEVILCLKNMGFRIKFKRLFWHNALDSCENIRGNIGRFVLEFEFERFEFENSEAISDFRIDFERRIKEIDNFAKEYNTKLNQMWDHYLSKK